MKSLLAALSLCIAVAAFGGCAQPPSFKQPPPKDMAGTRGNNGGIDLAGVTECGAAAGKCCNGELCDTGLTCSKTGLCCGAGGYACQTGTECCAGFACTAGQCCAGISSSCSKASDCCSGLTCTGGVCNKPAMGGGVGDACNASTPCGSGLECLSGTCSACGTTGAACCTTTTQCNSGLTCTNNRCGAGCGAASQACCTTGTPCTGGLTCTAGKCASSTPGGLGTACTPSTACATGLMCIAGTCQMPQTCTTVGAKCCTGNICQGGLQCSENGTCQAAPMCTAIEAACTTTASCCTGLQCQNTQQSDGTAHNECCVSAGTACPDGDLDCCGWLTCQNGKCTKQADGGSCLQNSDCVNADCDMSSGLCGGGSVMCGTLTPIGGGCDDSSTCCEGICATLASTGNMVCCQTQSGTCSADSDCCGKMVCGSGTCTPRQQGQSCIGMGECANGLACNNGTCGGDTSVGEGMPCTPGTTMCATGLTCDSVTDYCVTSEPLDPCTSTNDCAYNLDCQVISGFTGKVCCIFTGDVYPCTDPATPPPNNTDPRYCCSGVCNSDGNCQ